MGEIFFQCRKCNKEHRLRDFAHTGKKRPSDGEIFYSCPSCGDKFIINIDSYNRALIQAKVQNISMPSDEYNIKNAPANNISTTSNNFAFGNDDRFREISAIHDNNIKQQKSITSQKYSFFSSILESLNAKVESIKMGKHYSGVCLDILKLSSASMNEFLLLENNSEYDEPAVFSVLLFAIMFPVNSVLEEKKSRKVFKELFRNIRSMVEKMYGNNDIFTEEFMKNIFMRYGAYKIYAAKYIDTLTLRKLAGMFAVDIMGENSFSNETLDAMLSVVEFIVKLSTVYIVKKDSDGLMVWLW